MSKYVDSFLIAVPHEKVDEYKELARLCSRVWKEHGAIDYVECLADDVQPGKHTSFPQAVQLKEGETIVFAFITYRDRAHRDEVNKKAMSDERLKDMKPENMPFDGKRMIWGGFQSFIQVEG